MGVLRDRAKRQTAVGNSKMAAEDLAYTIEETDAGRYFIRGTRKQKVWSEAGCIQTIARRMKEGENWADKFWKETNDWMTTFVNGGDPLMADWATECWQMICSAYEKVLANNAPRDIELASKRGECAAKIFGDSDPYATTRDECFDDSESFCEPLGVESFGDTAETFGEPEGTESFGDTEETFG